MAADRPIHAKWSWDRILRSCYIKQADVLQGLYMFEDQYDLAAIERNFNFYEPLTVHESSLSASIHSIIANTIGDHEMAYEMYLRTARLDLDDYNSDTKDGLHITSMGGTWMSIVEGFAGLRVRNNSLVLNPSIPKTWKSYSFRIVFRKALLQIMVNSEFTTVENISEKLVEVVIGMEKFTVAGKTKVEYSQLSQKTTV
jgi:maltose phosphorylase